MPERAEPENVRARAADDTEGIRAKLPEAAHQAGDTDQSVAERGKLRRLAAEVRRSRSGITNLRPTIAGLLL